MTITIDRWLPIVRGHVHKKYGWIADRGHCLLAVDDLMQAASIRLVSLLERWPSICADNDIDENNTRLFWSFLKHETKQAVYKYIRDVRGDQREYSTDDKIEGHDDSSASVRTALSRYRPPSFTQKEIVDYFSILPPKDKLVLALRFFDGLTLKMIGDLYGAKEVTCQFRVKEAGKHLLAYARNLVVDDPTDLGPRRAYKAEIPAAVVEYLEARYSTDVAGYLGYVTTCFRADVSYLVDILGNAAGAHHRSALAVNHTAKLNQREMSEIDGRILTGESISTIARSMGLNTETVRSYSRREIAA